MANLNSEIVIIGAGASGLMAARELSKAGKKVAILEARDRIGGRIMPLDEAEFGYPAQGGAEFVHGAAPVTKGLIDEAGLNFVHEADDGEVWATRNGPLALNKSFIEGNETLKGKLEELKEDISIADFLEKHFSDEEHANLRNSIYRMVEGYEAADPRRVSSFNLMQGWFGKKYHSDGWIKEGYGALLEFLKKGCEENGVNIILNFCVESIETNQNGVVVISKDGKVYEAKKAVVTVPLPTLEKINFTPDISAKLSLVPRIGFGSAIKLVIKFKDQWWKHSTDKDLSKLSFALCNNDFTAWWTQYPIETNVFVGWMAGPNVWDHKQSSDANLLDIGINTLSGMFSLDKEYLKEKIVAWKVVNWSNEEYSLGAYSYTAMDTGDAYEKLAEPVGNIYFAGEALYTGEATATVEGALGSGLEIAQKILKIN